MFFLVFWVESKKILGNVWILLVSLAKFIIFSRFFLDLVTKSKNSLGKIGILLVSPVEIVVFTRFALDFITKSQKTLENTKVLTSDTSKIQTFPKVFGFYKKNQKNHGNPKNPKNCESKDSGRIFWIFGFASVSAIRTVCINVRFNPEAWNINFIHGALVALLTGSHQGRELQLGGGDTVPGHRDSAL